MIGAREHIIDRDTGGCHRLDLVPVGGHCFGRCRDAAGPTAGGASSARLSFHVEANEGAPGGVTCPS
jgi:hypothetical protein